MGNVWASDDRKKVSCRPTVGVEVPEEVTHMPASEPPSMRVVSCVAFSLSL